MPQVIIHMLTWNDRRYLPDLFKSIDAQTQKDFTLRILDNGSTDDTVEYIQQNYPRTLVGRNTKNNGFAGGHNQLFQFTLDHLGDANPEEVFVMVANSDMIWQPEIVEELTKTLAANPELASVQPKLYRAFGENVGDEILEETMKSDILDTTGMRLKKGFRMSDRGAGEIDSGQYDLQTDIFCSTGTMALFRLSALLSVSHGGSEIFDQSFFAYREDCDLAWRLRRAGWKSAFVPTAKAHHYRGMYGAEKQTVWQRIKNRRGQRPFFSALSTRNQILLLVKNLSFMNAIIYFPWIFFGEGGRVLYAILFEPMTRRRLLEIPGLIPSMLKKRKQIFAQTTVPEAEIRSYAR